MGLDERTAVRAARDTIRRSIYLTLATSAGDVPWASPLYYVADGAWDFFFVSHRDAVHSTNLRLNPRASWTIFDAAAGPENRNGVQLEGHAFQVGTMDLPHAISTFFSKPSSDWLHDRIPDVFNMQSFLSLTHYRFYKLVVEKTWILTNNAAHDDVRLPVDLRSS